MITLTEQEYKNRLREHISDEAELDRQWKMRLSREYDHNWHVAINAHAMPLVGGEEWPKFMYEAKSASQEAPRLEILFRRERTGEINTTKFQDNFTTCCLGVECRKCPHLLALEKAEMPAEQVDRAKAWTCVSHILMSGGDISGEGFVLTQDDRHYWENVYRSLASSAPQ